MCSISISKRSLKKANNKMNEIMHFTLYMYVVCDLHRLIIQLKKPILCWLQDKGASTGPTKFCKSVQLIATLICLYLP